jgi:hypothetical protein
MNAIIREGSKRDPHSFPFSVSNIFPTNQVEEYDFSSKRDQITSLSLPLMG